MSESILNTVKKILGIDASVEVFDMDLIIHINTVLNILAQIGVGDRSFSITGSSEAWGEFLDYDVDLNLVKTYVAFKVRTMFDPPTNSGVATALNNTISELEWRISVTVDPGKE